MKNICLALVSIFLISSSAIAYDFQPDDNV